MTITVSLSRVSLVFSLDRTFTLSLLENRKIDRRIGTEALDTLVHDGLLCRDYFILTGTYRPIECYAKVLPADEEHREVIASALRQHNIQLTDYIDISSSIGIQPPARLSSIGERLVTQSPYSRLNDLSLCLSQSASTVRSTPSTASNKTLLESPRGSNESFASHRSDPLRFTTLPVSDASAPNRKGYSSSKQPLCRNYKRWTVIKRHRTVTSGTIKFDLVPSANHYIALYLDSSFEETDMADEHEIITTNAVL